MRASLSLVALVLGGLAPLSVQSAAAQAAPLSCVNTVYAVSGDQAVSPGTLTAINTSTQVSTPVPIAGGPIGVNALGLSANGLFTYSYRQATQEVIVHTVASGTVQAFPAPLITNVNVVRGAVNPANGIYYFSDNLDQATVYAFNTTTNTFLGQVGTLSPDVIPPVPFISNGDFAFDTAGNLYVTQVDRLYRATSAVPTTAGTVAIPLTTLAVLPPGTNSPGIAFSSDGFLYINDNPSFTGPSTIFKIDPSSGALVGSFTVPEAFLVDLGSCSSPNTLSLAKNVQGRAAPGDQFGMAITGSGISMGNTATTAGTGTGLQPEVAGPVLAVQGNSYTINQAGAGTTNLGNYVTTWVCTDLSTGIVAGSGTGNTGTFTYPTPPGPQGSNVHCVFTDTPRTYTVNKVADIADAKSGDTVHYTVTVTNTGQADYTAGSPATISDDLTGVIDDAVFNNDAAASAGPAPTFASPTLSWAGPLPVGGTVTLTYSVTVNPAGQLGDNALDNVVTGGTNCPAGSTAPECRVHIPILNVADFKSVDPVSTTEVAPGQELTYTLTFTGQSTGGTVDRVDNLTRVLDDATITSPPVASDPALTVTDGSNGEIAIAGTLAPNQTVTVTFKVKVKPDGQRGDNVLDNFLLNPGETPPATCEPDNEDCTTNPVKTILATSGDNGFLPITIGAAGTLALGSLLLLTHRTQRRRHH